MEESLAEVFARHARRAVAPAAEGEALVAALDALVAAGRAAWPAIALDAALFVRHVARLYDDDAPVAAWLMRLHAGDLYLACACSVGHAGALAAFDRHCLAHVGRHLAQLRPDAPFVDEVRQRLREKLLVAGADGQPPRIAEYAGLGPLDGGWLRVVSLRVALDLKRHRAASTGAGGAAVDALVADARAGNPELGYIRAQYRALFQSCLAGAVRALPAESRNLLRMHVVDGVRLEQLAQLFALSRATVVRRLAAARALVVDQLRQRVQAELPSPLAAGELESLMGELVSQLDVSLSTAL